MSRPTLHGVNLGGWLLLEKWMTPTLFAGTTAVDEFTFMQTPGAAEKIEKHRQTFITEADFVWMREHEIAAVRIPVGYWVLVSDQPFKEATVYLDWAMAMAQKYHIQVVIDLHGLKGSQNGRDHSGRVGQAAWFRRADYREQTIETLEMIANRYKDYENFWGLQIINEPKLGLFHCKLRRYYKEAYKRLCVILQPYTRIIYSDAFTPRLMAGVIRRPTHPVVIDVHIYHMTTLFAQYLPLAWFFHKTKRRKQLLARLSKKQPIMIGEWSGVLRHETVKDIPAAERATLFRNYVTLQEAIFEGVEAWFYWNYKTEHPGEWNFRSQVEAGMITDRMSKT